MNAMVSEAARRATAKNNLAGGKWAVCDERTWISVRTNKRKFFGGTACHVEGMTRRCFRYFGRQYFFSAKGLKEFKETKKFADGCAVIVATDSMVRRNR